jgi:peroxiredoxin
MMKSLVLAVVGILISTSLLGQTIPRPATELKYNLATIEGSGSLAKYKGKVVVIEFLLTGCPHCKQVSKDLQKIQNEWGSRGLQVIGIAIDDKDGSKVAAFQRENGVSFPVGYTTQKEAMYNFLQRSMMAQAYMPQIAIIDKTGTIRRQIAGEDPLLAGNLEQNLRSEITKVLGGAPAPAAKPTTAAKPAAPKPAAKPAVKK